MLLALNNWYSRLRELVPLITQRAKTSMPPRTNALQRLITLLTATLAGHAQVTESAMLKDRVTSEPREVDVLVSATTATYTVNLGIEVIAWARPADTPWIEKMRAKHENLPTDKLILVSESGFSAPAKKKAEFYGIETLTIDEACEADWPLIADMEGSGIFEVTTLNFDIAAIYQLASGEIEQIAIPRQAFFPGSHGPITMDTFVRSILERDDFRNVIQANLVENHEHDFWFSYSKPGGLWQFDIDGWHGQIIKLRVSLKVLQTATPIRFGSGKFRSVPFVSGTSTIKTTPLQFVLARNPNGGSSGYLIDAAGVRSLCSRLKQNEA